MTISEEIIEEAKNLFSLLRPNDLTWFECLTIAAKIVELQMMQELNNHILYKRK